MSEPEELTFDALIERIGVLVEEVERFPEDVRGLVSELLDLLDAYHREGLARLVAQLPDDLQERLRRDPVVDHLLRLYTGPEEDTEDEADVEAVVQEALEEIRPYVHSHGGEIELVSVRDGEVTLRLMGACDGCPSSSITLTHGVEETLRARWPGFRRLRVHQDAVRRSSQQLLQIQSLRRRAPEA